MSFDDGTPARTDGTPWSPPTSPNPLDNLKARMEKMAIAAFEAWAREVQITPLDVEGPVLAAYSEASYAGEAIDRHRGMGAIIRTDPPPMPRTAPTPFVHRGTVTFTLQADGRPYYVRYREGRTTIDYAFFWIEVREKRGSGWGPPKQEMARATTRANVAQGLGEARRSRILHAIPQTKFSGAQVSPATATLIRSWLTAHLIYPPDGVVVSEPDTFSWNAEGRRFSARSNSSAQPTQLTVWVHIPGSPDEQARPHPIASSTQLHQLLAAARPSRAKNSSAAFTYVDGPINGG